LDGKPKFLQSEPNRTLDDGSSRILDHQTGDGYVGRSAGTVCKVILGVRSVHEVLSLKLRGFRLNKIAGVIEDVGDFDGSSSKRN
jgi:hypothetical protein